MKIEIPESVMVTIHGLISRGIQAVAVSDEGHLIFTLTDGSTVDLGDIRGPAGPTGKQGPPGPAGADGKDGATGQAVELECSGVRAVAEEAGGEG